MIEPTHTVRNSLPETTDTTLAQITLCIHDETARLINSISVENITRFYSLSAMYLSTNLYHADTVVSGSEIGMYN